MVTEASLKSIALPVRSSSDPKYVDESFFFVHSVVNSVQIKLSSSSDPKYVDESFI